MGGAIYTEYTTGQHSSILRFNGTTHFINNSATKGGALYLLHIAKQECFFQLSGQNLSNGIDVQLVFKNNSADAAGSMLYGGGVDNCKLTHGLDSYSSGNVFDILVHNDDSDGTQLQTFPLTQLKYVCVKIIFQTLV